MTTLDFFQLQRQIIDSLDFDRSKALEQQIQLLNVEMMNIFRELGEICNQAPDSMVSSLGVMYAGGGDFTTNIDKVGGKGTAVFAHKAIEAMIAAKQK